jgi:hypothetical protein
MVGYTLICVGPSLVLRIVVKFPGGGARPAGFGKLSIGNGPLNPDDKLTHTHTPIKYRGLSLNP